MPFTPTHIAAIVPIAAVPRFRLPFSALVIGSMVPDFPLWFPLSPEYAVTHSGLGMFTCCLPLGMGCFLAFQGFLKEPLQALMPSYIQARTAAFAGRNLHPSWQYFAMVALAILVGAATHLFWDTFTHSDRWGTRVFPVLNEQPISLWGRRPPIHKCLQYGSSLVFLPAMAVGMLWWLSHRTPQSIPPEFRVARTAKTSVYLAVLLLPLLVAGWIRYVRQPSLYEQIVSTVTSTGFLLVVLSMVYAGGCAWHRHLAKRPDATSLVQESPETSKN